MIEEFKKVFFFPLAWYFRIFASIRLKRWHPRIIVVTGSNGKTTLLHLLESQIGKHARYSHHANSAFGVPFDVLDLHRKTLQRSEWITFLLKAPVAAFTKPPKETIYIVEADADRPGEGEFLASFLQPEVVLWVSTGRTHSMYFDQLVAEKQFTDVDEAIAYEYGYFMSYCSKLAVIDGDSQLQKKQQNRTKAEVIAVTKKDLKKYSLTKEGTRFQINEETYSFNDLLPEEVFVSIEMCKRVVAYLDLPFDNGFKDFVLPSGRGSVFSGIKDTTLIDSTYNANLGSIQAILSMFAKIAARKKWVVIGDMLELGKEEKEEHENLATVLERMELEKIILVGERTAQYTDPSLRANAKQSHKNVVSFKSAKEALEYLLTNIQGEEVILFKGSQSLLLEGILEHLLKDKKDAVRLPRRGTFWDLQRKKKGL